MTDTRSAPARDTQRLLIRGQAWGIDDPSLQALLAALHDTPERPRCLCVPGGVEMYVARHGYYIAKRMPDSGNDHHPSCPSYEPEPGCSGLGELMGRAVREPRPGQIELRVDFPWARRTGSSTARGEPRDAGELAVPGPRMSLRALTHYLFERAGLNRWTPAMAGKRNQGVLCKYLLEAAQEVDIKGTPLAQRLYVPEPFREQAKAEIAQRRRDKFALLQPRDGETPLALVIGELKAWEAGEPAAPDCRLWIRHMPDAPLLLKTRAWQRLARLHAPLLQARDADIAARPRLVATALIQARRAFTYEVDTIALMLTSADWIPVEGVHELPLVQALVEQHRRFIKPLRFDAASAAPFPNALLLDRGAQPVPLHVSSSDLSPRDQALKHKVVHATSPDAWHWRMNDAMPVLP